MSTVDVVLTETRLWARGEATHWDGVPSIVPTSDRAGFVVGPPLRPADPAVSVVGLATADRIAFAPIPPTTTDALAMVLGAVLTDLRLPGPCERLTLAIPSEWGMRRRHALETAALRLAATVTLEPLALRAAAASGSTGQQQRIAVLEPAPLTTTVSLVGRSGQQIWLESREFEPTVGAADLGEDHGPDAMAAVVARLLAGRAPNYVAALGIPDIETLTALREAVARQCGFAVDVRAITGGDLLAGTGFDRARDGLPPAIERPGSLRERAAATRTRKRDSERAARAGHDAPPERVGPDDHGPSATSWQGDSLRDGPQGTGLSSDTVLPQQDSWAARPPRQVVSRERESGTRPRRDSLRDRARAARSPRERRSLLIVGVLVGAVVVAAAVTAVALGGKQTRESAAPTPSPSTAPTVPPPTAQPVLHTTGRVRVAVPPGWHVTAESDSRTELTADGSTQRVVLVQQALDPASTLADVRAVLETQIQRRPPGTFGPLREDASVPGVPALAYDEFPSDGTTVHWRVIVGSALQVSVGCRTVPEAWAAFAPTCDRLLRDLRILG
ncbi:type VII secretion-associated protein [Nocardia sp. NPDC004068]|uniref:type VII secretion-associated protein n=1 Tax=Nocardia sp. NPDC004068 TaxID=3364303 RepID=UPI003691DC4A